MKGLTEIKISEKLDLKWQSHFEGITIRYINNQTILMVELKDQSHLHGILNRIRDLNLNIISVSISEDG
jgi:hypothetical protein